MIDQDACCMIINRFEECGTFLAPGPIFAPFIRTL